VERVSVDFLAVSQAVAKVSWVSKHAHAATPRIQLHPLVLAIVNDGEARIKCVCTGAHIIDFVIASLVLWTGCSIEPPSSISVWFALASK
jgi:hypothetical protein